MPLILPANTLDSSFNIDNSLRFNDGDNNYLERTFDSGGSRRKFTISLWAKRSELSSGNQPLWAAAGSSGGQISLVYDSNDKLILREYNTTDEEVLNLVTNTLFRDPAAWYHIVAAVDTTQSTNTNRAKLYVNGELQTLGTATYPSEDYDLLMNSTTNTGKFFVGNETYASTSTVFDGYIAEFFFINDSQLAASSFAETDDNGVWIPKDVKDDLTFGTNGLYMEFKQSGTGTDASGMGADTSGEDHHFAVNNLTAQDQTTDTPTNNFMTLNTLHTNSRGSFSEGNVKVTTNVQGSSPYGQVEFGNFYVNKGKWYYEVFVADHGGGGNLAFGWSERAEVGNYVNGHNNQGSAGNVLYQKGGNILIGSSHNQATGVDSFTDSDIVGVALDLDNNKIYFHKNGNYQDDPTPAPASNNGRAIVSSYNNYWTPFISKDDTSNNATGNFNFGNPINTPSSGNADDNGYGNFEYDVPTGFYSLCTKNLAEFG